MSVALNIAKFISDIFFNFILSELESRKNSLILKLKFNKCKKKIKESIKKYILQNDGSILTSSTFEKYLKYQKPTVKIQYYVLEFNSSDLDEKAFIYECINECREYFSISNCDFTPQDECILKDFYQKLLIIFNEFAINQLSDNEKIILKNLIRSKKEIINKLNDSTNAIKDISELLKFNQAITNPDILHNIYDYLNNEMYKGEFEKVYALLPLIENKNNDLENAIKIKLHTLSLYKCLKQDDVTIYSSINDIYIHNDITRLLILHYFDDKEMLFKIKQHVINQELSEIIDCLITDNFDKFYEMKQKTKNNAKIYNFVLKTNFKNENWLIRRICTLVLYRKSEGINTYELINTLVTENRTYFETLILTQKKLENTLLVFSNQDNVQNELSKISDFLFKKRDIFEKCNTKTQILYYYTLTRALALNDKNQELSCLYKSIPSQIQKDKKIQAIDIYLKSLCHEIQGDVLVDFCFDNEEYWILECYLYNLSKENPDNYINFMNKHLFILKKHSSFFFIYYNTIKKHDGEDNAKLLLSKYKDIYSKNLEYWLELYAISNDKKNILNQAFMLWKSGDCSMLNQYTEMDFIRILIIEKEFSKALEIIKKYEALGLSSPELLRNKAIILNNLNYSLDAFQILLSISSNYSRDPYVIGTILAIAICYKREVPKEIINYAIEIDTSIILYHVAIIYERNNKITEAFNIATRSLLIAKSKNEPIFGYFFSLLTKLGKESFYENSDVNDNTAVILKNKNEQIIYCIHKNNILPSEPYISEFAIHIYRESAIGLGIFRKKENSKIIIDGIEYTISEILSLNQFLYNICLNNLIENGDCHQISIPTNEQGEFDIELFKEQLRKYITPCDTINDWITQNNDMSNFPIPMFAVSKKTNLSYQEFIFAFLENKSYFIREFLPRNPILIKKYILSFAAIAVLYKLNIPIKALLDIDVIITTSTVQEIIDSDKKIIQENNKDTVSSMGIENDKLYFHSASEEEKLMHMKDSTNFKNYIKHFKTEKNNNDIITEFDNAQLIELFGICDYDSISIAKNNNRVLVHPESMIVGLSNCNNFNFSTAVFVDFLIDLNISIDEFFQYMNKLVDFRFIITLTENTFNFILKKYNVSSDDSTKEKILTQWIDYLSLAQEIEGEYKKHFVDNLTDVFQMVYKSSKILKHPIYYYLFIYILKYKNLKCIIDKNGNLELRSVPHENNIY